MDEKENNTPTEESKTKNKTNPTTSKRENYENQRPTNKCELF